MNKPNLTESQKTLLKEAFQGITDHCTDTDNPNNESHRKELNRLINYHIRFGEPLERAVGDSYWSVMEAIDVENQLALEA
jgi:hypothetical protein